MKVIDLAPYRAAAAGTTDVHREPHGYLEQCPACGCGRFFDYYWRPNLACQRRMPASDMRPCGRNEDHRHEGVCDDGACGALVPFLRRLWRWCFRRDAHLHQRCTRCGAHWTCLPERPLLLRA